MRQQPIWCGIGGIAIIIVVTLALVRLGETVVLL